ncbi:hypothetical protein WME75_41145 [Sorangium sp. So ce1014]|uniref:hypothetical protein n=1 Tax=Sorangium sp. So ce1014 TaxID=3133326 RepID=UPI003F636CE3
MARDASQPPGGRDASRPPGTTPADLAGTTRGGMTLERYGLVSAHLGRFPRSAKAEVLARLEIADRDWDDAVCGWTDALADECADGGDALSNRFCQAFAAAEARLKREQPALASLGPLPPERRPPPHEPSDGPAALETTAPAARPVPAIVPAGMRHFTSLRETVEASTAAPRGPTLPFAPRAAGGPGTVDDRAASLAASGRAAPSPARPAAPPGGGTADLSTALASALGRRNPLPFNAARAGASQAKRTAGPAVLSLEQHASMCAEIAIAPRNTAEILTRYGLTEATRPEVDEHWRARIAAEPGMGEAWQRAYVLYRDWLLGVGS